MPTDVNALQEWSRRHDGYDVSRSRLVRGWLASMHVLAGPLARRRVPPDAVTVAGVSAAVAASRAPARPAAALVVAAAVLDGVDGAVALQRSHESGHGQLMDHAADRVNDALFGVALWRAGCPRRLATTGVVASIAFELLREGVRAAGRPHPGVVTVGERPMRVAAVVIGLMTSPALGALAVAVLSAAGTVQLAVTLDRSAPR